MNSVLNALKDFLLSENIYVDFNQFDRVLNGPTVAIIDKENPDDNYLCFECHSNEKSVRARYKFSSMTEEQTIVVDILKINDHQIRLLFRQLDKLIIEYQITE